MISLLDEVRNTITVIDENPELFHDGIDEELITLLKRIERYLRMKGEK